MDTITLAEMLTFTLVIFSAMGFPVALISIVIAIVDHTNGRKK